MPVGAGAPRSPRDRTSSFPELHNHTGAHKPAAVLDKGLKNQIAGRGEDSKAILGLNRPRGVFRQPSMGTPSSCPLGQDHCLLCNPQKEGRPQRAQLASKENLNQAIFIRGQREGKKADCWLHVDRRPSVSPSGTKGRCSGSCYPETCGRVVSAWPGCPLLSTPARLPLPTLPPHTLWASAAQSRSPELC